MPQIFISHSSKDDLVAEAVRSHLTRRGWYRTDIFLDFSVDGIPTTQRWKEALAKANASSAAILCLASPEWLSSKESQVERRVAETLKEADPGRTRAVIVAIARALTRQELREQGFGEYQIVDLGAAGGRTLITAELPGRPGETSARKDDIPLNTEALEKIERDLRAAGVKPEAFDWTPREPDRPSPYPGLEAFRETEAGVFFGRDAQITAAVEQIDALRRGTERPRVFTILAASGAGKSSFLRAGLWPRLARHAGMTPLVVMRPGRSILYDGETGLVHALADWYRKRGRTVAPADIRRVLQADALDKTVPRVLAEAARAAGAGGAVVLGIDQAEELFDAANAQAGSEAQRVLAALLGMIGKRPDGLDVLLVSTIRTDSHDALARALVTAGLDEQTFPLHPMSQTAYREVIRRPAQVALQTEREVIAPALVDRLVETFTGADALPLLALTLDQLFEECRGKSPITLDDYEAKYGRAGGDGAAVEQALIEAYRLAGVAGTDDTLRRLLIPELATWDPAAGETGAAKRRIAPQSRATRGDAHLILLADALSHPNVRLLSRGGGEGDSALEIAHEALLRVEPVKSWIEASAGELRLRDEVLREAAEWAAATEAGNATAIAAAIAARRGPRLEAALALLKKPEFEALAEKRHPVARFIAACSAKETEERDSQRKIIGRAFVKPALQALQDGFSEHALRLAAAGAVLADDLGLDLVPELWSPATRAIFDSRTRAVLSAHEATVRIASFSPDGRRIVTASDDNTARVWDSESGNEIALLKAHTGTVRSASVSPDGRRIVTASDDNTARVWDSESGN
ncbi:MAG: toll/interleukin-1 receptor domain-containing protein, partial [Hyphomicrobiaceae bacterium]